MSEPLPNPNLTGLEAALRGLAPAPARLDRDRLLFRAGQVSARRGAWLWPSAAAVLGLVTGALALTLALRPEARQAERIHQMQKPSPHRPSLPRPDEGPRPAPAPQKIPSIVPPPSEARPTREESLVRGPLPEGYLRLRNELLRWGPDALPSVHSVAAPVAPSRPTTIRDLPAWLPGSPSLRLGGSL